MVLPTRRMKKIADSSTPSITPLERSWVATTVTVVATMTIDDCTGVERSFRTEAQSKVPTETMIITATRAAIGIRATQFCSTRIRNSRNRPAQRVDSRPRAPEVTLMIDWPIMAQPAMPPNSGDRMLAMPWPRVSRSLSDGVSVRSSSRLAVSRDSSRPTKASVAEIGPMIRSVSQVSGTAGRWNIGSVDGIWPMSPTVRTSSPVKMTKALSDDDGHQRARGRPW